MIPTGMFGRASAALSPTGKASLSPGVERALRNEVEATPLCFGRSAAHTSSLRSAGVGVSDALRYPARGAAGRWLPARHMRRVTRGHT